MKFSAPWTFLDALETAYAHPPSVDAAFGAWPFHNGSRIEASTLSADGKHLATLGRRWTIRVIVVPGERLVTQGPYRFLRHPNYAVVTGEIAVVPLALGLPTYALVFSVLNAGMLAIRITAENAALNRTSQIAPQ